MGPTSKGERHAVLIVEDEPFIRYDLVDFFEDAGFEVFEAESADAAVEQVEAQPSIRIVLTDVNMPGSMDGLQLAQLLSARHPPMLLMIASGAMNLASSDMPVGAMFFPKPFDPRAVLSTIKGMRLS